MVGDELAALRAIMEESARKAGRDPNAIEITCVGDTRPETGSVRATRENPTTFAGTNEWGGREKDCVVLTAGLKKSRKHEGNKWDIVKDAQDCNAVFLF